MWMSVFIGMLFVYIALGIEGKGVNTLFPSIVVCSSILLSAYVASNRILKITDPQKKPEWIVVPSRRTIMHAIHEAGVGRY